MVARLPSRNRVVLEALYFEQRTAREIGRKLGVTISRVYQLRERGIRTLVRTRALRWEILEQMGWEHKEAAWTAKLEGEEAARTAQRKEDEAERIAAAQREREARWDREAREASAEWARWERQQQKQWEVEQREHARIRLVQPPPRLRSGRSAFLNDGRGWTRGFYDWCVNLRYLAEAEGENWLVTHTDPRDYAGYYEEDFTPEESLKVAKRNREEW
jgi:hypothetical protein